MTSRGNLFIPFPTGRVPFLRVFQAFHAWLPSFSPSGTKIPLLPAGFKIGAADLENDGIGGFHQNAFAGHSRAAALR